MDYTNSSSNKILHPVNSCEISCGNSVLGEMGIMHPAIAKNIDKRKNFAALELDVDKMIEQEKNKFKLVAQSKFQTVSVDYNFVADKTMPYSKLENVLSNFKASYILEHSLKDIYINDEVLKDKISYTINFNITPKDRTLEASDIEKFSKRLIASMEEIGVVLRS